MALVDRCKKKFKSKTRSMYVRKVIFHNIRIQMYRRVRLSLRRIRNAVHNLLEFGKYVLAQKEYSLASLTMNFDAELIRRCDRDSTHSAIILQARLLSEVQAIGPARKIKIKDLEKPIDPLSSTELVYQFKSQRELSVKNIFQQAYYKELVRRTQTYFNTPYPSIEAVIQTNRNIIFDKDYSPKKGSSAGQRQASRMIRQMSFYYFKDLKQPFQKSIELKPLRYFQKPHQVEKHLKEAVLERVGGQHFHKEMKKSGPNLKDAGLVTLLLFSLHFGHLKLHMESSKQQQQKNMILRGICSLGPQYYRELVKLDASIKYNILYKQLKRIRAEYHQVMQVYRREMWEFIDSNKDRINLMRIKIMMEIDSALLQKIINREEELTRIPGWVESHKLGDTSYPFYTMIFQLAELLPDAPKKPQLQLKIKDFNRLLQEYIRGLGTVKKFVNNNFLMRKLVSIE